MAGLLLCCWEEILKYGGVGDGLARPPNLDHIVEVFFLTIGIQSDTQ